MPYVSARYQPPDPLALPGSPRQILAVDEQGQEWALREDSEEGQWLEYIANGGTIDPAPEPKEE